MAGKRKSPTERVCKICACLFPHDPYNPRKTCSAACLRVHFSNNVILTQKLLAAKRPHRTVKQRVASLNPRWVNNIGRAEARILYPDCGFCGRCGAHAVDRHHIDRDATNNERSNIEMLCRRCHAIEHGQKYKSLYSPKVSLPKPCIICQKLSKPLRRGRCGRCSDYFNNHQQKERPIGEYRPDRKEHCQRGHPLSGKNLYLWKGVRFCRECRNRYEQSRKQRRAA
jgi:hypothetical protein